ncbi:hypothetical protein GCM10027072_02340 [Streptomyces bullii]
MLMDDLPDVRGQGSSRTSHPPRCRKTCPGVCGRVPGAGASQCFGPEARPWERCDAAQDAPVPNAGALPR